MFRRDAFVLLSLALVGIVFTIYIVIGSTPFFPRSFHTQYGECPANAYGPEEHGPVLDEATAEWFSNELLNLQEHPLFPEKARKTQTVRFTLIRSFLPPMVIRTTETDDGHIRLVAKRTAGLNGCDLGQGACAIDRVLTPAEQARLSAAQAQLRKASYGCPTGPDGAMWLLEASGRGEYRFWSEWTPVSGELRELGLVMLDLAGWG